MERTKKKPLQIQPSPTISKRHFARLFTNLRRKPADTKVPTSFVNTILSVPRRTERKEKEKEARNSLVSKKEEPSDSTQVERRSQCGGATHHELYGTLPKGWLPDGSPLRYPNNGVFPPLKRAPRARASVLIERERTWT